MDKLFVLLISFIVIGIGIMIQGIRGNFMDVSELVAVGGSISIASLMILTIYAPLKGIE